MNKKYSKPYGLLISFHNYKDTNFPGYFAFIITFLPYISLKLLFSVLSMKNSKSLGNTLRRYNKQSEIIDIVSGL